MAAFPSISLVLFLNPLVLKHRLPVLAIITLMVKRNSVYYARTLRQIERNYLSSLKLKMG